MLPPSEVLMLLSAVLTIVISSCTTPRPRLVAASARAVARGERDDVLPKRACSGRLVLSEVVCIDHTQLSVRICRQPMSCDRTSLSELLPSWPKYLCLALHPRRRRRKTWTRDPKSPRSRHSSAIRRAPTCLAR